MKETVDQYVKRMSAYTEGLEPMDVLRKTPKRLAKLVASATPARLRKRPAPEKWSVAEVLAHLAESEIVFAYRIRMIASMNTTRIQAFDQNLWQANAAALRNDPKGALEMFHVLRKQNLAFLGALPKESWSFYGMHEERGRESIERLVRLVSGHDVNHVKQIETLAARAGGKGKRS